jgi:hypothetical protein
VHFVSQDVFSQGISYRRKYYEGPDDHDLISIHVVNAWEFLRTHTVHCTLPLPVTLFFDHTVTVEYVFPYSLHFFKHAGDESRASSVVQGTGFSIRIEVADIF